MTEEQTELEAPAQEQPEEEEHHQTLTLRAVLAEVAETVIFILLAFFIVRGLAQNFKIEGHSMDATLHHEQYILVNKLVYFHFDINAPLRLLPGRESTPPQYIYPFHMPRRGDVIVFHSPTEEKDYIKRVIGLPGERVEVREGKVFINGAQLSEPYVTTGDTTCDSTRSTCDMIVPPDAVYVMGDNRPNSSDSRVWSALPLDKIIGQAWLSYWPQEHWGVIDTPSYAQE